jgi:hypothetical protein
MAGDELFDSLGYAQSRRRHARERLAAWRAAISSTAIGPAEPEYDFTVWEATRREIELTDDILVRFEVIWLRWNGERFHRSAPLTDLARFPGLLDKRTEWRMSEGYPVVMEAWIDFCAAVAQANVASWTEAQHERERQAEIERARLKEAELKTQAAKVAEDLGPVSLLRQELALLPSAERVTADLRLHELAEAQLRLPS